LVVVVGLGGGGGIGRNRKGGGVHGSNSSPSHPLLLKYIFSLYLPSPQIIT